MSEFVFGIGYPVWPPVDPVALARGGDPNNLAGLTRMSRAQINRMPMMGGAPSPDNRVVWFLERMLHHHGGALIVAQRAEMIELRRRLATDGLRKPEYGRYDALFAL